MPIYIGNQKLGSLYLGSTKIKEAWVGDVKVYGSGDPYNPLGLPPFTIRCKITQGNTPTPYGSVTWDSVTLVDPVENVWDITKNNPNWDSILALQGLFLEQVLGANTHGVTNISSMFNQCWQLETIPIFDTSLVTAMGSMFYYCYNLKSVPLFDTSSCTTFGFTFEGCRSLTSIPSFNTSSCRSMQSMFSSCQSIENIPLFDTGLVTNFEMAFFNCSSLKYIPTFSMRSADRTGSMFMYCRNVESGALALYTEASSSPSMGNSHAGMFSDCGIDTPTGLAELQQIPQSWGGLAPG